MTVGRTVQQYTRVYIDGYDLSGYARQIGPLKIEGESEPAASFTDAIKNVLVNQVSLGLGTLNGFFDNTATSGLHVVANGAGVKRVVMCPVGIRGVPAQGDPTWCGEFAQLSYNAVPEQGFVTAAIEFGQAHGTGAHNQYQKAWGTLLHAKSVETDVNSAVGIDGAAQTTAGGFLCYHLFTSDGTVTLKVQDASSNLDGSFGDLSGATSGSIDATTTPVSGIVALATTATVKRYLRWQLALGTASTATFALAFVRG